MPKFKDLGINAIPMTMQPPEIGEGGGGYRVDTQCPDEGTCGETCVCSDDKPDYFVATQCPDEGTCGETCVPEKDETQKAGAFAPEAIAQLRQQLEERINL